MSIITRQSQNFSQKPRDEALNSFEVSVWPSVDEQSWLLITRNFHTTTQNAISALNCLTTNSATLQRSILRGDCKNENIPETTKFLQRAGMQVDDLKKLKIIHVTGTKGKVGTMAASGRLACFSYPPLSFSLGLDLRFRWIDFTSSRLTHRVFQFTALGVGDGANSSLGSAHFQGELCKVLLDCVWQAARHSQQWTRLADVLSILYGLVLLCVSQGERWCGHNGGGHWRRIRLHKYYTRHQVHCHHITRSRPYSGAGRYNWENRLAKSRNY